MKTTKSKTTKRKPVTRVGSGTLVRQHVTDWQEIAEGLYFSLNNDGVVFNNPLSKIMAESTSRKYERAKGIAHAA
jgi:hypothetical protein